MENRKAFNFYRSYYDVALEIENDQDKLNYLMAILRKQFEDIEPDLKGLAKFAYISQKFNIDSQVDGYKHKVRYQPPTEPPSQGTTLPPVYVSDTIIMTTEPPYQPPSVQEQEKGEEKEKVEEKEQLKIIMKKFNID